MQALRAGASGFLGKSVAPAEMLEAIRLVAAGESLLSPKATRALVARYLAQPDDGPVPTPERLLVLTDREREVVALVAHGLSNDEIAGRLFVSPLTVKTHVNRAMTKLDVRDRAQLVVTAYQSGLVQSRPIHHLFASREPSLPHIETGMKSPVNIEVLTSFYIALWFHELRIIHHKDRCTPGLR